MDSRHLKRYLVLITLNVVGVVSAFALLILRPGETWWWAGLILVSSAMGLGMNCRDCLTEMEDAEWDRIDKGIQEKRVQRNKW